MEIYDNNDLCAKSAGDPPPTGKGTPWWITAIMAAVLAALIAVTAVLAVTLKRGGQTELTGEQVASKALAVVVRVDAGNTVGSGVAASVNGRTVIITNNHVMNGEKAATVESFGGQRFAATLSGYHEYQDIAVLECPEYVGDTAVLAAERPAYGQKVFAVGNNVGLGLAVFDGAVSVPSKLLFYRAGNKTVPVIQITAAVNTGMSGGGLFNERGELLGINTYQSTSAGDEASGTRPVFDMNYSVPAPIAYALCLAADGSGNALDVPHVEISHISSGVINIYALSIDAAVSQQGLTVSSLRFNNPPVYMLGEPPQTGDVIVKVGGADATDIPAVFAELYAREISGVGQPLEVVFMRENRRYTVTYGNLTARQ